jgi:hypothetical protein
MTDLLNWPKIGYQYGPFALNVFLLLYVERAARRNRDVAILSPDWLEKRLGQLIYVAVWIAFIACMSFSVYAWKAINLPPIYLVQGAILHVPADDKVVLGTNFQPQEAYLALHEDLSKLDWLFISPIPLPDTMTLYISVRTLRASGTVQTSFFSIPIARNLYAKPVNMLFDSEKLTIDADGKPHVFLPLTTNVHAGAI